MSRSYLITGGAGFIGSHLARYLLTLTYDEVKSVIIVDSLDYAGSIANLGNALDDPRLEFYKIDIRNTKCLSEFLERHQVDIIFHLAAHSHVDRSINNAEDFITNNVLGAHSLAQAVKDYYPTLDRYRKRNFRLINFSTDEVYGDCSSFSVPAVEETPYNPSSPYSASKASADMIFNSYRITFKLPILTINACNHFGSYQYPEKLIPLAILKFLRGQDVPLYKDGSQRREWIYVKDSIQILHSIALKWDPSHSHRYNISGQSLTNREVLTKIVNIIKEIYPEPQNPLMKSQGEKDYFNLIREVEDRKGHDKRYWTADFLLQTTGIKLPQHDFDKNLRETVLWYFNNQDSQIERLKVNSQGGGRINDFFAKESKSKRLNRR